MNFEGDLEVVLVKKRGVKITCYYSSELTGRLDSRAKKLIEDKTQN